MASNKFIAFARTQPPKNELETKLSSKIRSNLQLILRGDELCAVCFELENLVVLNEVSTVHRESMMGLCVENMLGYLFGERIQDQLVSGFICGRCIKDVKQAFTLCYKVKNGGLILEQCIEHLNKQVTKAELNLNKDLKEESDFNIVQNDSYNDSDNESYSDDSVDEINDTSYKMLCTTCQKTFCSESALAKHIIQSHLNSNPHCSQCAEEPCCHDKYVQAVTSQKTDGQLTCVDCGYNCAKMCILISHVNRVHLNMLPFTCDVCGQSFPCKNMLRLHIRKYHNEDTQCQYCDKQFIKPILEKHEILCQRIERQYRCAECQASFDSQSVLVKHKKKHKKKLSCNLCSKVMKSEHLLKRHMFRAHDGPKPDINEPKKLVRLCSICPALLSSARELKVHLKTHGPNEKHKCNLCNKEFKSRKLYHIHCSSYQHQLKVNPSKTFNFKCDQCDYSAMSKIKVEYHKNAKHLRVKPYKCDICSKQLSTELGLKYHKERHEGTKSFQCSICTNLFTCLSGLKKHILRLHSDKKPVQCSQCDKSFVCKSEYNIHKLRSHSEKSVSCPICASKFSALSNLRGHVRKIHFKGLPFEKVLSESKVSEEVQEMIRDHRLPF